MKRFLAWLERLARTIGSEELRWWLRDGERQQQRRRP